jgi:hypothetical protein
MVESRNLAHEAWCMGTGKHSVQYIVPLTKQQPRSAGVTNVLFAHSLVLRNQRLSYSGKKHGIRLRNLEPKATSILLLTAQSSSTVFKYSLQNPLTL